MKTRVILLTLLLVAFGAHAGDVSLPNQTARQEIRLYKSDGSRKTTGAARCYMDGADSSDTEYQVDLTRTIAGGDTFWVAGDTTQSGDQYRDVRVDIYSTDGSDSLLLDNYLLHGRWVGKNAVDATAVATDAIDGSKVIDRTLQAADADTGAWTTVEIQNNTLLGEDISTAADLDVNSATIGDSLHVAGAATFEDSLKAYGGIYVWTGSALVLIPWALIPTDSPSTNDVLEFNGTRAQWDSGLALSGLTVSGNTTFGSPASGDTDSTIVADLHRVKYRLVLGGNGQKGSLRFNRHGYFQDIVAGQIEAGDGNAVLMLPYEAGAAGDHFSVMAVAGDTTKVGFTTPKWEWAGQKTYSENTNTWQYFVISGMDAPLCVDPATDASWPVLITPAYFAGLEKRFSGYVSNDTLVVQVVSAFTQDWVLNIHIRESD